MGLFGYQDPVYLCIAGFDLVLLCISAPKGGSVLRAIRAQHVISGPQEPGAVIDHIAGQHSKFIGHRLRGIVRPRKEHQIASADEDARRPLRRLAFGPRIGAAEPVERMAEFMREG